MNIDKQDVQDEVKIQSILLILAIDVRKGGSISADELMAGPDAATEGLKERLGTNPDMWDSHSHMR